MSISDQQKRREETRKVNELLRQKDVLNPVTYQKEIRKIFHDCEQKIFDDPQDRCNNTEMPPPYLKQQALIQRYFTPDLKINGMLIWHSVGVGKTCLATSVLSQNFAANGWRILWVTRSTLKDAPLEGMFRSFCDVEARAAAKADAKAAARADSEHENYNEKFSKYFHNAELNFEPPCG